ncbi:MAG: two-component regulator propeller domain-containing protein [Bacteroidales bacterium]|nr:two-component regulator propeller domain-containing protein [Bacteroidales bacterium]
MRPIRTLICILVVILFPLLAIAQGIPIGHWRAHLPYSKAIALAESKNLVYTATPHSLFYYNKDDASVVRLSKVNGLSDVGISVIEANPDNSTIVVAYSNTNIDLITNKKVLNISDIKRKPILGNKVINNITFIGNRAYLACGFGIVVLDIARKEIADTYYIGLGGATVNVLDMALYEPTSMLYAVTDQGIYKAWLHSPNLADFAYWSKDLTIPTPNSAFNQVAYINNKLIVNKPGSNSNNDTLFVYNGSDWSYFNLPETSKVRNMRSQRGKLIIARWNYAKFFDQNLTQVDHLQAYHFGSPNPNDIIISAEGLSFIADDQAGLVRRIAELNDQYILPEGPSTTTVYAMASADNYLWAVPGGRNTAWVSLFYPGIVYGFFEGKWLSYNPWNTTGMGNIKDVLCLAVDPNNPKHLFAGTWGNGLLEINDGVIVKVFDSTNSSLRNNVYSPGRLAIGGVAFDQQNNLWVTNSSTGNLLSVMKPNGSWRSFNLSPVASAIDFGGLVIDQQGQKWMMVRNHGLVVFTDNGTIDNVADDKAKRLSAALGNGTLPGTIIMSLAVDHNGELWIGSNEGVAVIRTPGNVFNNANFDAQRPLVVVGNHPQYLLNAETVTAIAIDGANRKWFGTDRAGAFLMSEDGTQQVYHFHVDNSPMLSNSITSIVIDKNGEVFFGTANGIVSYRAEATTPEAKPTDVLVFPNPVRPGYEGVIAIKGLMKDTDIKITDISGNLVFKTKSYGGQAIWNGMNFDGRRANSGVYLVFISNEDGSETLATKILFMN